MPQQQQKTAPPYSAIAAVSQHGGVVDGNCEWTAVKVACNQLMGRLRTVALLQTKGFQEVPQHMACTDLPQQWRVPCGSAIKGEGGGEKRESSNISPHEQHILEAFSEIPSELVKSWGPNIKKSRAQRHYSDEFRV